MTVENQILYLLSKVEQIEGKELIKIYEARSYTAQTIRNMLSKLKKLKYIYSPDRSMYAITPAGRASIRSMYNKENFYNRLWNKKWYMVLMEIPETERKKRDSFRRGLIQLGFGSLYKSVYVYPWDITAEVIKLVDHLEIEEYVTILVSEEFILNKIRNAGARGPNEAKGIWALENINELYKEKLQWFNDKFKPQIHQMFQNPNLDTLDIFIYYLEIQEAIHTLLSIDPMLPPEFLPPSWIGTQVLSAFYQAQASLVYHMPEGSFYSRFVDDRL